MVIKINGEELAYTLEDEKTIGEVLGGIEAACRQAHETVVDVQVDGKQLTAAELDRLFAQSPDSGITIDLSTVSGESIRRYMQELVKELLAYAEEFEQIPVYMQTGKDSKVLTLLETFSVKLHELYRAFLLPEVTELPLDIRIGDKPLDSYQKEINALMQDIVSAIEEKDIIQIGDLAEYELAPLVKTLVNGVSSAIA